MKRLCLPVIGPVIVETHGDGVLQENGTETPVTIFAPLEQGYDFSDLDSESRAISQKIAKSAQACRGSLQSLDAIDLLIDTVGGIELYSMAVRQAVEYLYPKGQGVSSFIGGHAVSTGCNLALFYAKRCVVAPYSTLAFHFGFYEALPGLTREEAQREKERTAKDSMLYLRWLVYVLMDPTIGAVSSPLRNRLREAFYRREDTLVDDERWCMAQIRGDAVSPDISDDPQDFDPQGEFQMSGPELANATKHVTLVHSLTQYERMYTAITGQTADRRNGKSCAALFFRLQDLHFRAHAQGIAPPYVIGDELLFAQRDEHAARALADQWMSDYAEGS